MNMFTLFDEKSLSEIRELLESDFGDKVRAEVDGDNVTLSLIYAEGLHTDFNNVIGEAIDMKERVEDFIRMSGMHKMSTSDNGDNIRVICMRRNPEHMRACQKGAVKSLMITLEGADVSMYQLVLHDIIDRMRDRLGGLVFDLIERAVEENK